MKRIAQLKFALAAALTVLAVGCGGASSGPAASSSDSDELSQYLAEHPELDSNLGEEDMESNE